MSTHLRLRFASPLTGNSSVWKCVCLEMRLIGKKTHTRRFFFSWMSAFCVCVLYGWALRVAMSAESDRLSSLLSSKVREPRSRRLSRSSFARLRICSCAFQVWRAHCACSDASEDAPADAPWEATGAGAGIGRALIDGAFGGIDGVSSCGATLA
jgi:hypothetical protein